MAYDDDPLNRALLAAGFAMMGQPNFWQALGRAGMFGMQGYDQALTQRDKRAEEAQQRQMRDLQMTQAQQSLDQQKRRQDIMTGPQPAGSQPSMADAPGWQPQVAQNNVAQMLLRAGFTKDAEEYAKAQNVIGGADRYGKVDPKDYTPQSLLTFARSGNYQDLVPRDKLVAHNTGDRLTFTTEYDTTPRGSLGVNMSPEQVDASKRGWANVGLDQQRLARGELKEVTDPATGAKSYSWIGLQGGNPTVTPTGASAGSEKEPAAIRTALASNDVTLAKIGQALTLVQEQPGAFGVKNYLGDAVRQRTNPEGVDARAAVADIGSQKIHDRSGAAVTLSEAPRLTPFIPTATDTDQTIVKKLMRLQTEYAAMHQELSRGSPLNNVATPPNRNVGAIGKMPSIAELEAEALRRGMRVGQ